MDMTAVIPLVIIIIIRIIRVGLVIIPTVVKY